MVDREGRLVDAIVGGVDTDEDRERLDEAIDRALET